MHAHSPRTQLHFGHFELDPTSGELRRAGETVRLQPQPCKVLVHLATRPGRVVPRRELYQVLWGEGRHVDAERGLNFCIKELRKVLDDDARAPTFVETLPRRGYRFLAEVTATSKPQAPVPARPGRHRLLGSKTLPAAAVLAALGMVVLVVAVGSVKRTGEDAAAAPRVELKAPEAYLEGRYLLTRGTEGDLDRGLAAFRRALEVAPEYAPAWTALAEVHLVRARLTTHEPAESLGRAVEAARRAVALAPQQAAAQLALSKAVLYRDFNWAAATAAAKRALELDPQSGPAHSHWAFLLAARGRHAEALAAAAIARRLAPENPAILLDLGWYHYLARDYEAAVTACAGALELAPEFTPAIDCLESAHAAAGRLDLALAAARRDPQSALTAADAQEGNPPAEAWHQLRVAEAARLEEEVTVSRCAAVPLAVELAELGEADAAFAWLETAWRDRSSWLPLVAVEPRLDPLHDDPRWSVLLKKVGL